MNIETLPGIEQLLDLHLPFGSYVIYGSAPLAIRGIRKTNDLDILVTPIIFEEIASKFPNNLGITGHGERNIQIGDIEICDTCPCVSEQEISQIIKEADVIEGYPFMQLSWVIYQK